MTVTRLLSVAWLAFVWVLLWGSFTLLTIIGGVLVGFAVTAMFRAGRVERLPFRPVALVALVWHVACDLVVSSFDVSVQTLRYGRQACGAVLEVPLLSTSDRVVSLIAGAYTLSPGTLVLQIDLERSLWYIYILGPREATGVERARTAAMEIQRSVLAAVGAPEELAEARRLLMGRSR